MSNTLDDSQFNLWRAMVALVMADGERHEAEEQFFAERFENLGMSPEQKDTLMGDLQTPKPVSDFFEGITVPRDRSQFIFFARQLFWSDGDFSRQEQAIHERLTEKVMAKVDLEAAMHKVDSIALEYAENIKPNPVERMKQAISEGFKKITS